MSQTDIDTKKNDEAENDSFETLEPDPDNPVKREFEIGQPGNQELQEDERAGNEPAQSAPSYDKPSQRKFNP